MKHTNKLKAAWHTQTGIWTGNESECSGLLAIDKADTLKCVIVILVDALALQRSKIGNVQPFSLAVPTTTVTLCFTHKHATNISGQFSRWIHYVLCFYWFHICHCVVFICNKTRTPNMMLNIISNIWDSNTLSICKIYFWFQMYIYMNFQFWGYLQMKQMGPIFLQIWDCLHWQKAKYMPQLAMRILDLME